MSVDDAIQEPVEIEMAQFVGQIRRLVRIEMVRRGLKPQSVNDQIIAKHYANKHGPSDRAFAQQLSRGRYSAALLVQIADVMGCDLAFIPRSVAK